MSKYTMELRHVLNSLIRNSDPTFNSTDYAEIIKKGAPLLFNFNFPIYDENYRVVLETLICKHFYMREIGFETFTLFKLKLDEKLNLGMPYFNKLYKQNWDINPFNTVDVRTEHSLKKTGDTTNKVDGNVTTDALIYNSGNNTRKYTDSPQGTLQNIYQSDYLSEVTIDDNSGLSKNDSKVTDDSTTKVTLNTLDEYLEHRYGYEGINIIDQYEKLKDLIISVDKLVLDYLEDLFIQIW